MHPDTRVIGLETELHKKRLSDVNEFLRKEPPPPWYRQSKWIPELPRVSWDKNLRKFSLQTRNCSITEKSLTKTHFIDILIINHRKWWQFPVCGFKLWL